MDQQALSSYFSFFNEVGIIQQLSSAAMEQQLPDGLLVSHFAVVNHLMRLGEGRTPLSIAKAFQVPKTTLTHTLNGLGKSGLIEMRPNPKDGRSKLVYTTQAGREFRDQSIESMAPMLSDFAQTIPLDEIKAVLPLLVKIREKLDRDRGR
ncbi:MarR family winged helix-turn-helix transcriptional regulator [Alphaproteobacteria bacterium]|jgi:DNA-binding MarR family transcriptional regulator|nr:MarR family winged helix-turn-helix transcriptional regulator [Alphaproteobacteria bacterium]